MTTSPDARDTSEAPALGAGRPEWTELLGQVEAHLTPVVIFHTREPSYWLVFEITSDAPTPEAVTAAVRMRDLFAEDDAFRAHVLARAITSGLLRQTC